MRRAVVALAALSVLLVACGDDDEPEAAPTTAPADPTAASADPPEPTDAPTTSEATTTTAPTITTTTIAATTTTTTTTTATVAPTTAPSSPADAAVAALQELFEWRKECARMLPACDTSLLPNYLAGDELADLTATYDRLNGTGYEVRNVESIREFILAVDPSPTDPDRYRVRFCGEDAGFLVIPTATGDSVVDGTGFFSEILEADMRLDADGIWRNYGYFLIEEAEGEENSLCR